MELNSKVMYNGDVFIVRGITPQGHYIITTSTGYEIVINGSQLIAHHHLARLKKDLTLLVMHKRVLQDMAERRIPFKPHLRIDGLEYKVPLTRGICSAIPLYNLKVAKGHRDAFHGWNCHVGEIAYPIGGRKEFEYEEANGTTWLNEARWDAVDFLIEECDRLMRLITFTNFK